MAIAGIIISAVVIIIASILCYKKIILKYKRKAERTASPRQHEQLPRQIREIQMQNLVLARAEPIIQATRLGEPESIKKLPYKKK